MYVLTPSHACLITTDASLEQAMDPVSALGVAAAAVQFFQFSVEAIKLCKEIRENGGTTDTNKRLEKSTREVRQAYKDLEARLATGVYIQKFAPSTPCASSRLESFAPAFD